MIEHVSSVASSLDSRSLKTIELQIVQRDNAPRSVFLILDGDSPIYLGTGRYALVVAAASGADPKHADAFFALKFLKYDPDNKASSRHSRTRFFNEVAHTRSLGHRGGLFVRYVGYSRIRSIEADLRVRSATGPQDRLSELGPVDENTSWERSQKSFEEQLDTEQLARTSQHNIAALESSLSPYFLDRVQGEFFTMYAEEGTLEDLLFHEGGWSERAIFRVDDELRRRNESITSGAPELIRQLYSDLRDPKKLKSISPRDAQRLASTLGGGPPPGPDLPEDDRGVAILNHIARTSPSVRNRIVLSLVSQAAESVEHLHREEVPTVEATGEAAGSKAALRLRSRRPKQYVAHRDLKPGNFLFSFSENGSFKLRLTDLGFAGRTQVDLRHSMSEATRDPANLDGSYLYRGPEQLSASIEVQFRHGVETSNPLPANAATQSSTAADTKPASAPDKSKPTPSRDRHYIEFYDVGRVYDPQPGDWLECRDLRFGNSEDHKCPILEVKTLGDRVRAYLAQPIVGTHRQMTNYEVGYLTKPSGQHTDIFALGCLLYRLASGGRNPELFYVKCLDFKPTEAEGDVRSPYNEFSRSCLALATALCLDDPETIVADFQPYWKEWGSLLTEVAASVRPSLLKHCRPHVKKSDSAGLPSLWDRFLGRDNALLIQETIQYVRLWRKSPSVREHLTDISGNPIPFPIVFECIRCMVRDRRDSYVTRTNLDTDSYFDHPYFESTAALKVSLKSILDSRAPCAAASLDGYQSLGQDPLNLFLRLRVAHGLVRGESRPT